MPWSGLEVPFVIEGLEPEKRIKYEFDNYGEEFLPDSIVSAAIEEGWRPFGEAVVSVLCSRPTI
jgi:hypothetical protein